jgi:hypothetical protein
MPACANKIKKGARTCPAAHFVLHREQIYPEEHLVEVTKGR